MRRKIIVLVVSMLFLLVATATNVSANSPPETPEIHGSPTGSAGSKYTIEVCTTDPDGDDVYFCIDWGDDSGEQCLGPYSSDSCIQLDHTYDSDGSYTIQVKARDTNDAESGWETFSVSMPKSKVKNNILFIIFERILEKFPIIAQIFFL